MESRKILRYCLTSVNRCDRFWMINPGSFSRAEIRSVSEEFMLVTHFTIVAAGAPIRAQVIARGR